MDIPGLAVAALLVTSGAHADPGAVAAGKAIAEKGNGDTTACSACHGRDGGGQEDSPRLAGLDAAYFRAQLVAFAAGTRENAQMATIARAMDANAAAAAAAYYASLPPPARLPPAEPKALLDAGGELAQRGDWGSGIPPCALCHGPNGRGVGAAFPAIAGQPRRYIAAQLNAWRSGARHDDPQGLMRTAVARMSDAQVAAIAAYYATLPAAAAAPGGAR